MVQCHIGNMLLKLLVVFSTRDNTILYELEEYIQPHACRETSCPPPPPPNPDLAAAASRAFRVAATPEIELEFFLQTHRDSTHEHDEQRAYDGGIQHERVTHRLPRRAVHDHHDGAARGGM